MLRHIKNIYDLGVKELIELSHDIVMLCLILYAFTLGVYVAAHGEPEGIAKAPIAIVDEDQTQLSQRIIDAFLPPLFLRPKIISRYEADRHMDNGDYTFIIMIPHHFERDALGGRAPELQLLTDATQMTQAFVGTGYIQQIINNELNKFLKGKTVTVSPAKQVIRNRFNPNAMHLWHSAVNELINNITMLAIVLTGTALIREREKGTLEHLMVMPVTPFEVIFSKIWSMMLVVLIAASGCLFITIHTILEVPFAGSMPLFLFGVALYLFTVTSLGLFLACIAQSMPQMGILLILFLLPMNMLSGGKSPHESMPVWVQHLVQFAPSTHFVQFSEAILFRSAGFGVVWKPFLALFIIGAVLFICSMIKFKRSIA